MVELIKNKFGFRACRVQTFSWSQSLVLQGGQKWSLIQYVEFLIIAVTENFIIRFYLFDFKFFSIMRIAVGLAGKPLPAKYVSANILAQAIQNVLNNGSYYNTAQKVFPTMQKQDGVGKAVALLNEQF
jgi:hypothetical protein